MSVIFLATFLDSRWKQFIHHSYLKNIKMTSWDITGCHDRLVTWLKEAEKGRAAMLQLVRRGSCCLTKNTAIKREFKNRASHKYYPLTCENRNELPFAHEERLRSESQVNIFFGLIWLVCFWDFGPSFWMPGRCVYFYMTAVWYSEDDEKHQLPPNTVKKMSTDGLSTLLPKI